MQCQLPGLAVNIIDGSTLATKLLAQVFSLMGIVLLHWLNVGVLDAKNGNAINENEE